VGSEMCIRDRDCLVLDDMSEHKASPRLFISNNDVKCSHASTTSRPDGNVLFYLMSKGIGRRAAMRMAVKAFVWPAVEVLEPRALAIAESDIAAAIESWADKSVDEGGR